jgi:HSP20 family protein
MADRDLTPWSGSRGLSPLFGGGDPFANFRREMDRLFDDFFTPTERRSFASGAQAESAWPSLDVEETDKAFIVHAEVPGMEQKDIELGLADNTLTISGERVQEHKDDQRGRAYAERFYGRFRRTIPLPSEVDADKVEATFKNGLLTVTLPKNEQARDKTRRIEIR